ncbi:xanthine dehydrogenase family protein subunit M [Pedobacter frigidisoli]|uniref:Xanthine dehydrogenase family protein subunit M n=1 Tax=Pedobacter frigidisoli TaxID=2530455 RepID=A0A4R0P2H8_9SPHI|nr:xanthine dehydrogenase family protein subunit M [Pedobacter frigidisoli]TCD07608.1 xanthine dehydrogenase family protein subunit M [Pedobacter frigidisoli]
MNSFEYKQAKDIPEALSLARADGTTTFVAGGTNLLDLWKYNITNPSQLIDINHLTELSEIRLLEDGVLMIGAGVRNAETAYHPIVEQNYPLLSRAILAGASPQIRNMATNGGNLLQRTRCYYFYDHEVPCNKRIPGSGCPAMSGYNRMHAILGTSEHCIAVFPSDMCVALAALDAVVNVTGPEGNRSIAFADFHRLPGDTPHLDNNLKEGELITAIKVPEKGFATNYAYLKLRDRHSYAFALVSVATGLALDGNRILEARIALGGVAHKPWRSLSAEAFLKGREANAENFAGAADLILKEAKGFGHNDFKIKLAKKAIIRNGLMALKPESQLPGAQPSA